MAKKEVPEKMIKVLIDNYNLDNSNARVNNITHFKANMDEFTRKLESATGSLNEFTFTLKNIVKDKSNPSYAGAVQTVMAKPENEAVLLDAINSIKGENSSKGGWNDYNVHSFDVPVRKGYVDLHGKEAYKLAEMQVQALGGEIWKAPTKKKPDRVRFYYPDDASDKAERRRVYTNTFSSAKKLSKKEEERRQVEEEERKKKEQERLEKGVEKRKKEAEKRKKEAEKEQEKKSLETRGKVMGMISAVLGILVTIADIVRRILTNTLERAAETKELAVKANVLGVGTAYAKGLDFFDTAHGLGKDAHLNAIQSVQNMFGDVTNLDENALGVLARVMGNSVADMVRSGMGGKEPLELLDNILDAYFKQYKEGKNSLGQYVGTEQAKRELTTVLNGISPEIANLFAHMVKDYESGNFGDFDNTKGWRETTTSHVGTNAEAGLVEKLGDSLNKWKSFWDQAKWSVLEGMSRTLISILDKLNNTRTFMSASESLAMDRKNLEKNQRAYARNEQNMQAQLSLIKGDVAANAKELGLDSSIYTAENMRDYYLLEHGNISKFEKDQIKKRLKDQNFNTSYAKNFLMALFMNRKTANSLGRAISMYEQNYRIEKENAKGIGGGIDDLSTYDYVMETKDAYAIIDKYGFDAFVGSAYSNGKSEYSKYFGSGFLDFEQEMMIQWFKDRQAEGFYKLNDWTKTQVQPILDYALTGTTNSPFKPFMESVLGKDFGKKFNSAFNTLRKSKYNDFTWDRLDANNKYIKSMEILTELVGQEDFKKLADVWASLTSAYVNQGKIPIKVPGTQTWMYANALTDELRQQSANDPGSLFSQLFSSNMTDLLDFLAGKTGTLTVTGGKADANGRVTVTMQIVDNNGKVIGSKEATITNMDNKVEFGTIKAQVENGNILTTME